MSKIIVTRDRIGDEAKYFIMLWEEAANIQLGANGQWCGSGKHCRMALADFESVFGCKPRRGTKKLYELKENKGQTIREALDEKRTERKGNCTALVLCKYELFYLPDLNDDPHDTVYPVSVETAKKEAAWFGVPLQEE